jgi:dipeptidyl aminopeptidase/acylaminoacyl peptidase
LTLFNRCAGFIAGLLLCAAGAQAAPPPAEAFYRDADTQAVQLSPSGRWLAMTGALGTKHPSLLVFDVLAGGQPQRVAQFKDGDVTQVRWVNDTRLVFGVQGRESGSDRPRGALGLYAVNADGSQRVQLVRNFGSRVVNDAARPGLLSWNHRLLHVPIPRDGKDNNEVLIGRITLNEQRTVTPLWLDTLTGRTRPAVSQPPADVVHWVADPFGEPRAAVAVQGTRQTAYWRQPGSDDWLALQESLVDEAPFNVNAVDADGTLYVTQRRGAAGQAVLTRYDFEQRAPAEQALVVTPGFDFRGGLRLGDDGRLRGVRVLAEGESTAWLTERMQAIQADVDGTLPGRINDITCRRCGQPDMVLLVHSYSDREPGEWWVHRSSPAGGKAWQHVGRARAELKPEDMATLSLQRIRARDGLELPVWITRPANAKGPLPAVVLVHGGPWLRGNLWRWNADAQFLASRGYIVIEPEFRGSTGYGEAHHQAGFKQWGQAMQNDVADALKWAQQQGLASDKACIVGNSYGGYSALMGLANDPALYRCGVAGLAVTDLELLVRGSWWVSDDASDLTRSYVIPKMIGDPQKDAAMIAAHSPVNLADKIKAPVMLVFGEEDQRVPLAHGERMRRALRDAGNDPVWVTYAQEGHGFGLWQNRVDYAQRMEAFLARHLRP